MQEGYSGFFHEKECLQSVLDEVDEGAYSVKGRLEGLTAFCPQDVVNIAWR
jgi:hypothetical protein